MIIVHVARIQLNYGSGMGRISAMWRNAFIEEGHQFVHIGLDEVPYHGHYLFWGFYAMRWLKLSKIKPDILLVHEPYGGWFASEKYKLIVFSHGVEERSWKIQHQLSYEKRSLKSYLLPFFLRFICNNLGFGAADLVMLSNSTDKSYLENKGVKAKKLHIFKNGYFPYKIAREGNISCTILYNGTWIKRKGIDVLCEAFNRLLVDHPELSLVLAGVSLSEDKVIDYFNPLARRRIKVIERFDEIEEEGLYAKSSIFLLPSYFEGQSLALTQAMAMGLCPVVSNNSGQIDLVIDGFNGLIFKTNMANSLVEKIEFLLKNRDLINIYGKRAKESVSKYTWEYCKSEFCQVCLTLV